MSCTPFSCVKVSFLTCLFPDFYRIFATYLQHVLFGDNVRLMRAYAVLYRLIRSYETKKREYAGSKV